MKEYYEAKSRDEAWEIVNRVFPSDYLEDGQASRNAGYPVYYSTAAGNNSWISDLSSRLEMNIETRDASGKITDFRSVNVWIEEEEEEEEKPEEKPQEKTRRLSHTALTSDLLSWLEDETCRDEFAEEIAAKIEDAAYVACMNKNTLDERIGDFFRVLWLSGITVPAPAFRRDAMTDEEHAAAVSREKAKLEKAKADLREAISREWSAPQGSVERRAANLDVRVSKSLIEKYETRLLHLSVARS